MKAFYISLLLCVCVWPAKPALSDTSKMTVTIPDRSDSSSPCVVTLPVQSDQCTENSCKLPLSKKVSLELHLTCVPSGSLTGIERPPPGAWEESVRVGNSNVHILLIDGDRGTPEAETRDISFCFIGRANYFCGSTITPKLKRSARRAAVNAVKTFIKGVEWPDAYQSPAR